MSNPTVVIIPGAWQPAEAFEPFGEHLRDVGYPTEVISLKSVGGTETPLAGLKEDADAVSEVLTKLADEARDIVLLCHSYGGVIGSCAIEGLDFATRRNAGKAGGVILTVYMSAFMLPKGMNVLDGLGGKPMPWMKIEEDKCFAVASELPQIALNDMPAEKAKAYSAQLTHTSVSAFATPSTFEPWANAIPCTYIFCEIDNALPLPVQQQMASQLGPNATTFSLKAGHCPFLSMPEQLRDVIVKASEVGLSRKAI
ncbi:alpha/beta-hydrolase [Mollisia scopiformis]|uniref:Alpha/beta-hydrolase n=1 Tax=Mollisia scopiformis TaxID=149040 RepID=A0A132B984_MOLSC|nr:alpha/beta-hydrolase [Mollisia scopiformis]KUJ08559.1 alpha/beta-hydrolase [Mollisia scopiformis]